MADSRNIFGAVVTLSGALSSSFGLAVTLAGAAGSALAILRYAAVTTIHIRPTLLYPPFSPFPLRYKSFEDDVRLGLFLLREQPRILYRSDLFFQFEIRLNRKGERPLHVDGVEIVDTKLKRVIARAPIATKDGITIEGHNHGISKYLFETAWDHLTFYYKPEDYPDLRIRVKKSSGGNALLFGKRRITAKQLRIILNTKANQIDILPPRPD